MKSGDSWFREGSYRKGGEGYAIKAREFSATGVSNRDPPAPGVERRRAWPR